MWPFQPRTASRKLSLPCQSRCSGAGTRHKGALAPDCCLGAWSHAPLWLQSKLPLALSNPSLPWGKQPLAADRGPQFLSDLARPLSYRRSRQRLCMFATGQQSEGSVSGRSLSFKFSECKDSEMDALEGHPAPGPLLLHTHWVINLLTQ